MLSTTLGLHRRLSKWVPAEICSVYKVLHSDFFFWGGMETWLLISFHFQSWPGILLTNPNRQGRRRKRFLLEEGLQNRSVNELFPKMNSTITASLCAAIFFFLNFPHARIEIRIAGSICLKNLVVLSLCCSRWNQNGRLSQQFLCHVRTHECKC